MPPKRKDVDTSAVGMKRKRTDAKDDITSSGRPKRKSVGEPQYCDKRKKKPAHNVIKAESSPIPEPPKKRGRPPKDANKTPAGSGGSSAAVKPEKGTKSVKPTLAKQPPPVRKRGRPSKNPNSGPPNESKTKTTVKGTDELQKRGPGRPRKQKLGRGRPRKVDSQVHLSSPSQQILKDSGTDSSDDEGYDEGDDGEQYWLMKAEPNDRFEKGHNVKFSIDDLAAASGPEPWDGVRNYVARNNMRAMRKGDLAFFYHSNCTVPGVVGVMRIVIEHQVDKSALDPSHPYFDPKSSPENPKWDCVHVEFVKKFDQQITLKMLGENAASTGELASMQVLKQKRLSVTAVKPREWRHVLQMAGEDMNLGKEDQDAQEFETTDDKIQVDHKFSLSDDENRHDFKSDTIEGEVGQNTIGEKGEDEDENIDGAEPCQTS